MNALTPRRAGLLLALLQSGLLLSLGGRMVADRAQLPRAWVQTAPQDPDLPIRGRYVSLQLLVPAVRLRPSPQPWENTVQVQLLARGGRLEAIAAQPGQPGQPPPRGQRGARLERLNGAVIARLDEPVAYFIPPGVADPSRRAAGEQLWVEVSLPPEGLLRPIQLGVSRPLPETGAAPIRPLQLHRPGG